MRSFSERDSAPGGNGLPLSPNALMMSPGSSSISCSRTFFCHSRLDRSMSLRSRCSRSITPGSRGDTPRRRRRTENRFERQVHDVTQLQCGTGRGTLIADSPNPDIAAIERVPAQANASVIKPLLFEHLDGGVVRLAHDGRDSHGREQAPRRLTSSDAQATNCSREWSAPVRLERAVYCASAAPGL